MTKNLMRLLRAGAAALACVLVACCGGGGSDPGPTVIRAPDAVLSADVPRVLVASIPDGFHPSTVVSFDVFSVGYFGSFAQAGQGGHFGLGVRTDLDRLPTAIFGHGVIFGNVSGAPGGNPVYPSSQLESWCNGLVPGDYLLTGPGTPPVLLDGVAYHVRLESDTTGQTRTLRYAISSGGVLLYDSGPVADPNQAFDLTKNGVWVGHVFDGTGSWAVTFSNITIEIN